VSLPARRGRIDKICSNVEIYICRKGERGREKYLGSVIICKMKQSHFNQTHERARGRRKGTLPENKPSWGSPEFGKYRKFPPYLLQMAASMATL
jgi:hypothetical protein